MLLYQMDTCRSSCFFLFFKQVFLLPPNSVVDLESSVKRKKINCIDIFQDNSTFTYQILPLQSVYYLQQCRCSLLYSMLLRSLQQIKVKGLPRSLQAYFSLPKFTKGSIAHSASERQKIMLLSFSFFFFFLSFFHLR